MIKTVVAISLAGLLVSSAPSSATILIFSSPGAVQPAENVLFQGVAPTGNMAFGVTNQTGASVVFTGVEPLATPSGGQARIEAADGGLSELSFGLESGLGFREVEFNIFGSQSNATSVMLNFTDQFGAVFSNTFAISNGQNFFSARGIDNQFIRNVSFSLNDDVRDVRQFRIGGFETVVIPDPDPSGIVPEPQTWALLMAGFGLVGAAMRRRKAMVSVTA